MAKAAMEGELAELAATPPGGRNARLNRACWRLWGLVCRGLLPPRDVLVALADTAVATGLPVPEVERTLRSAMHGAEKQVQT